MRIVLSILSLVAFSLAAQAGDVAKRRPSSTDALSVLKQKVPAGLRSGTITGSPGDGFVTVGMPCTINATYDANSDIHIDVPNAENGDNYEDVLFEPAQSTFIVTAPPGSTRINIKEPYDYTEEGVRHHGIRSQNVVIKEDGTVTAGPDFSCKPN